MLIGYRSDKQRAIGRWRTPYIVFGGMLTYGGLATAPFSLLVLGSERIPFPVAMLICTAIFLAYGIGVNIVETAYLALVSDLTPQQDRGRVVAALWMMLVLGTIVGSIAGGLLLAEYNHIMLIRVMQGSATIFIILTFLALVGRERLRPDGTLIAVQEPAPIRMTLRESLATLWQSRVLRSLFGVLFLATLGFAVQDVLLEPYGGDVLNMTIASTTRLTALWGVAMLVGAASAGFVLWRGRSAALPLVGGGLVGALGFALIIASGASTDMTVFHGGVALIGIGRGLFITAAIALVMALADAQHTGLFVSLWGVTQALAQGFGTIGGGVARDAVAGAVGNVATGYQAVYAAATLVLVGALVLVAALGLGRKIREGAVRSPWSALRDMPADQMIS
jgi:BCD family chlorophyll transporter-like MFS transporter